MRNLYLVLVFLFLFVMLAFSSSANAALTLEPMVDGLSAGNYKPLTIPSLTGANFSASGKINVGGKWINIPGYIPPASTAPNAARLGLWANPWLIGAGLLGWAGDAGLGSDQVGGWIFTAPGIPGGSYYGYGLGVRGCEGGDICGTTRDSVCSAASGVLAFGGSDCVVSLSLCNSLGYIGCTDNQLLYMSSRSWTVAEIPATSRPATQEDFLALPPPSPSVLAEMAPQIGVDVDAPVFEPLNVPIGDIYTKPDGSTAQPMAQISPASNGQVTVDTYDQPMTDPQGNPTPTAPPVDTQEPPPEAKTDCDKYPNTVGCTDLGTPADGEALPHTQIPLSFNPLNIPRNATCPAPMTVGAFGQSVAVEYDAACTYSSGLRPIVLAVAYLSAAFIIFGVPRANNG